LGEISFLVGQLKAIVELAESAAAVVVTLSPLPAMFTNGTSFAGGEVAAGFVVSVGICHCLCTVCVSAALAVLTLVFGFWCCFYVASVD
jgi:hypothetical protein